MRRERAITEAQKKAIIDVVYEIWISNPELRLGQLIANSINERSLFHVEDGELRDALLRFDAQYGGDVE